MSEWISAENPIPEEYECKHVLIWHSSRRTMFIGFQTTSYEWCDMNGRVLKIKPTHWMPLPEPPKAESAGGK